MKSIINRSLTIVFIIISCYSLSNCDDDKIVLSSDANIESVSYINDEIEITEVSNYIINLEHDEEINNDKLTIVISLGATISEGTLDEQGNVTGLSFEDGVTKTLTITSEDGELTNSYDITVTIDTSFISRWNVYGGDTIVLPLYEGGVYNFIVNWGDGSPEESINSPNAKHEYSNGGIYTITTKGELEGFNFEQTNTSSYKIIDIVQWGNLKLGNLGGYFSYCAYIKISANDSPNLSETINLSRMFYYASYFNSDIDNWDVSYVTNMNSMFYQAGNFNRNISGWNVSNVTDMNYMFAAADNFNQYIGDWDVSRVTNMRGTFYGAGLFKQDISDWNVSSVTDMSSMFKSAYSFNSVINSWNVSNVTDMNSMFERTTYLNIDLSSWDVSNVVDMSYMFNKAYQFNSDIKSWNVSSVTNMKSMFNSAKIFNQDISELDNTII